MVKGIFLMFVDKFLFLKNYEDDKYEFPQVNDTNININIYFFLNISHIYSKYLQYPLYS